MDTKNKWKEIWERRNDNFSSINMLEEKSVFLELKRIDGFDIVGGGIPYAALIRQHDDIVRRLSKGSRIKSIFEVGCGCGADLYLLWRNGYGVGGIDYSSSLIGIAGNLFLKDTRRTVRELICDEAVNLPTGLRYDAIFANSVFSYFPSEEYAGKVLDKMLRKTKSSIGLIDIHDIEKKEQFEAYRRETIEDYDEKYKDLKKLFYPRSFFRDWAERNNCEIQFFESDVEGYWNSRFVFDVYLYRK